MPAQENSYEQGQTVRCMAVFVDPKTETQLSGNVTPGTTVLPVISGVLGAGFVTGAQIALGEEMLTVGAPGASTTAIPLSSPTTEAHRTGEKVSLRLEPSGEVAFVIKQPNGHTQASKPGVKEQLGVFHLDVSTTPEGGTWKYRATDGEGGKAAIEGSFYVKPSAFAS